MPRKKGELNCICKYCGKSFHLRNSIIIRGGGKYCSRRCCFQHIKEFGERRGKNHPRWKGIKINKICKQCGKTFSMFPGQIRQRKGEYCCKSCYSKSQIKKIDSVCKYCGKIFKVIPSRKIKGSGKYCSKNCVIKDIPNVYSGENAHRWMGGKIKRICLYCGNQFECNQCMIKKGYGKYCSRKCHFSHRKETGEFRGENSPSWKGGWFPYYGPNWKNISRLAIERAEHKSEIRKTNGMKLDVHHIIPFRRFIEKYVDLCLKPYIEGIEYKSFNVIPLELIPKEIFYEANRDKNLIVLTENEHKKYEGKPFEFFMKMMAF